MNADHKHKAMPYHVTAQEPVQKWRTATGYKIERIMQLSDAAGFWKVALDRLAARLKLNTDNYVQLYRKFKHRSTDLTEEELDLLCDTACDLNDMHCDVCEVARKYWDTHPTYIPYFIKCKDAFQDAFDLHHSITNV